MQQRLINKYTYLSVYPKTVNLIHSRRRVYRRQDCCQQEKEMDHIWKNIAGFFPSHVHEPLSFDCVK